MAEIYVTLFFTPVFAFLMRHRLAKIKLPLFLVAGILLFLITTAILLKISFVSLQANTIFACAVYFFVGLFVFQIPRTRNFIIKSVGVLGVIAFSIFPFLSLIIIVGVAFMLGDLEEVYSERYDDGNICRVTTYGNATTPDGGYKATIYRDFRFLEYEIKSSLIDTTGKLNITPKHACEKANSEGKS